MLWSSPTGPAAMALATSRCRTNVTLRPLPSAAPELNPLENVWEGRRKNKLAMRFDDYHDIVEPVTIAADSVVRFRDAIYQCWPGKPGALMNSRPQDFVEALRVPYRQGDMSMRPSLRKPNPNSVQRVQLSSSNVCFACLISS